LHKLKFDPSYRLKVAPELSNPLENFGILLCSILRITEQLFAYGYCKPSSTVLEPFILIALELFELCFAVPHGTDKKVVELS
jgi:hypothetical protein